MRLGLCLLIGLFAFQTKHTEEGPLWKLLK